MTFVRPLGDGADECANVEVVDAILTKGRYPGPEDGLRQAMHPPLSFALYAACAVPLEAVATWLPAEVVWNAGYRIAVPLDAPSTLTTRLETSTAETPGPASMKAATLRGLRLVSVALWTWAAFCCIRACRLVFTDRPRLAAAAVGFVFLVPQAVLQSSTIATEPLCLLAVSFFAVEAMRGLRRDPEYRPLRAGLAVAVASLTRHAGALVLVPALYVCAVRARQGGCRQVALEALLVSAPAVVAELAYAVFRSPFAVARFLELHPDQLRSVPAGSETYDSWLGAITGSFFAVPVAGHAAPATLGLAWGAILAAALVCGFASRKGDPSGAEVPPASLTWFALLGLVPIAALPFFGNWNYFQFNGRFLWPAVPMLLPFLAFGFARAFALGGDRAPILTLAAAPAAVSGILVLTHVPAVFHPRAEPLAAAAFYADCGGVHDPGRVRGTPMREAAFTLFPGPSEDFAFDPSRVEYEARFEPISGPAWLHVSVKGGSVGAPFVARKDTDVPKFEFLTVRIVVNDEVFAFRVMPRPGVETLHYRIPASLAASGRLRLRFEAASVLSLVSVHEIRIDGVAADPSPWLRACAAAPGIDRFVRIGSTGAPSRFALRVPAAGNEQVAIETPAPLTPGTWRARVWMRTLEPPGPGRDVARIEAGAARAVLRSKDLHGASWSALEADLDVAPGAAEPVAVRLVSLGACALDVDSLELYAPPRD